MANDLTQYSSVSSFYYVEFLVDDSLNKNLMSNFRKVRIENNITNAYPVVTLEFFCDNQIFIQEDIYPHRLITMNLYYCNENNEKIMDPLIFDLFILEMNMDLPPKTMNNVSNQTDFQRRNMILTCVPKQCFELMTMTVNKIWDQPTTVQNIVKELCESVGISTEFFEPTNCNSVLVEQCLIPPMTFRAAIDYLDNTFGIYNGRLFRYVNYNGTFEMWDLHAKYESLKSNAVYKIHKLPTSPATQSADGIFKRAAEMAEKYADHYITYDSVSTINRSNDAFIKRGFLQTHIFHPSTDIAHYVNINMEDIAREHGINSDAFAMKCNQDILKKRYAIHYDGNGIIEPPRDRYIVKTEQTFIDRLFGRPGKEVKVYDTTPINDYTHIISAKETQASIPLSCIQFNIYRKIKFHLLMHVGIPVFLQPYSEHETYSGSNYAGSYLVTRSLCVVTREGPNGQIGDEMNAYASVVAGRTSQSQDESK